MLRIVIHNLIFIVKYDKKPGYKFMLKKGSVFGGVMKFLRKELQQQDTKNPDESCSKES